jgi:hypothetical protein
MAAADFTQRDTIRRNFAADLIAGHGVEIGAGAYPQALPPGAAAAQYDLRDAAELKALFGTETIPVRPIAQLPSDFPAGADFLIAHNVLEHAPDPIGELIRWNRCVRDGGVVLLSLPHHLYCPDARRTVPPLSHLIDDYLNATDGRDFISREHGASFALGWWEDFCRTHRTHSVGEFSRLALDNLTGDRPDFHWHAFDSDLAIQTAMSAASLSGTEIEMLRCWRPELGQSIGDILIAYRIVRRSEPGEDFNALLRLHRQRQAAVEESLELIGRHVRGFVEMLDAASPRLRVFPLLRPFLKEGNFCFVTPMPRQLSACLESRTEITVTEDGRPLGPPDSLHQLIRDQGGGAFSVWGSNIYFSSSDGSDCNTNGRRYALAAVAGSDS